MFRYPLQRTVFGALLTLCVSGVAFGAPSQASWVRWFNDQINQHPEVIAAKERKNSAFSTAEGRERPLYNPELDTEYEREGDANNYRVGINQTVDWWGKRDAQIAQAGFSRTAALQGFELTVQERTAEALRALVGWQAADETSDFALRQEMQLGTLLELIQGRLQAGDLGQVDAELAYLSLSQRLNATAQAQAQLKLAEAQVRELLPAWSSKMAQIPRPFWSMDAPNAPDTNQTADWVDAHPAVISARAQWDVLQQSAELAQRETKADPTFGINAGRTDRDNVLAVTFSIPLNVRNNFSADARAANQEALSAEAEYLATRRKQQFAIEGSQAALGAYQERYRRWQTLMQGRGERIGDLLERQWQSGDLSTTEYLLTLQQRAEGLVAGIELRTQFRLARVDWLLQSGQIDAALTRLKQ